MILEKINFKEKTPDRVQAILEELVISTPSLHSQRENLSDALMKAYNIGQASIHSCTSNEVLTGLSKLTEKVDQFASLNEKKMAPTYAEKLKLASPQNFTNGKTVTSNTKSFVILIYPKDHNDKTVNINNVKEVLKNHLPLLQIKRLHNIRKSGILLEINSKCDLEKAQSILSEALTEKATITLPRLRIPELRIKDIGDDLSKDDIINYFQSQNKVNLKETISGKKCFITKTKFGRTDAVVLISNPDLNSLLSKGKAFLGYKMHDVSENFRMATCRTCFNTGHKEDECHLKGNCICINCGGEHNSNDCKNKTKFCWRCNKYSSTKTHPHAFGSDNCVLFQNEKRRLINITSYDD